ncbi:MAG TPA: hypothetical protein VEF72_25130, partial [Mycobacterium sp.]|nr:hypothetical protein [Mycobacterium sp.]
GTGITAGRTTRLGAQRDHRTDHVPHPAASNQNAPTPRAPPRTAQRRSVATPHRPVAAGPHHKGTPGEQQLGQHGHPRIVAIGEQNAKRDAYIARILADAPPLSEARLDKIASLLRAGVRTNNDTSREAS